MRFERDRAQGPPLLRGVVWWAVVGRCAARRSCHVQDRIRSGWASARAKLTRRKTAARSRRKVPRCPRGVPPRKKKRSGCTTTTPTRCSCSRATTPTIRETSGRRSTSTSKRERHIITTSGSVYIPAGLKHCPLGFNRVDRPFRFLAIALSGDGHYLPEEKR